MKFVVIDANCWNTLKYFSSIILYFAWLILFYPTAFREILYFLLPYIYFAEKVLKTLWWA